MNFNAKVSVIMPAYNSEKYIGQAINSVIEQTYSNWELIIIDDFSTDSTRNIVEAISSHDSRIKLIELTKNEGAAIARNTGIQYATGKYIAFLDSDDLWDKDKLKLQIHFMQSNNYYFSCTYYGKIDKNGDSLGNVIKMKKTTDYNELLKNCPGNSTVIYDAEQLGKYYIPKIRKRNDYLMWLQIVKKSNLYCYPDVLSVHRVHNQGISSNKASLVKYHWWIYRDIEKLDIVKSVKLLGYWILKAMKHVKVPSNNKI